MVEDIEYMLLSSGRFSKKPGIDPPSELKDIRLCYIFVFESD